MTLLIERYFGVLIGEFLTNINGSLPGFAFAYSTSELKSINGTIREPNLGNQELGVIMFLCVRRQFGGEGLTLPKVLRMFVDPNHVNLHVA